MSLATASPAPAPAPRPYLKGQKRRDMGAAAYVLAALGRNQHEIADVLRVSRSGVQRLLNECETNLAVARQLQQLRQIRA